MGSGIFLIDVYNLSLSASTRICTFLIICINRYEQMDGNDPAFQKSSQKIDIYLMLAKIINNFGIM